MNETAGFGLGLAITNAIVLAHDGTLSLHDRQPHGLVVRMQLPVCRRRERSAA
jgi:K+-sensing histidine kinase KdpD